MNKRTPRTDPVYSMPKPTDNAFLQEVALNAVKQIAGHAGDAMRYMVETLLTREEPEISKDLNNGQTISVKSKWQQRIEEIQEIQERQRQMKAAKFPSGGVKSKFEPKSFTGAFCANCGGPKDWHEGPELICPYKQD